MNRDIFGSPIPPSAVESPRPGIQRLDWRRIYPALVFAPLFYLLVRHLPPVFFFILVTIVSLLALWEFYGIYTHNQGNPFLTMTGLAFTVVVLAGMQWAEMTVTIFTATLLIFLALMCFMTWPATFKNVLPESVAFPFGVLYIGLGLGHFLLIRNLDEGDLLVFFVILVSWAADIGAYYTGITMGRRQLAPQLSPQKTVEGFIGGLVLSVIVAEVCRFWFLHSFSAMDCLILGIVLACVGLLGDLAESAFKRSSGVKDSGNLIPGHGGVLDRVDSLLLTAPTFYYYVLLTHSPAGL